MTLWADHETEQGGLVWLIERRKNKGSQWELTHGAHKTRARAREGVKGWRRWFTGDYRIVKYLRADKGG